MSRAKTVVVSQGVGYVGCDSDGGRGKEAVGLAGLGLVRLLPNVHLKAHNA